MLADQFSSNVTVNMFTQVYSCVCVCVGGGGGGGEGGVSGLCLTHKMESNYKVRTVKPMYHGHHQNTDYQEMARNY